MKRIPSLDGLRAIAVLVVIVGHSTEGTWLSTLAILGVHVFFVLSGYLITSLLQEERAGGEISLTAFYWRRCFRIFPEALAFIFVAALLIPASRFALPWALTYTVCYHLHPILNSGALIFGHLWSLSVEEQFYLLWPAVLVLFYAVRGRIALGAIVTATIIRGVLSIAWPSHDLYLHVGFPTAMDSIAIGCLLAIYEPQIRKRIIWMAESTAIVIALPLTAWVLIPMCWGGLLSVLWAVIPALIAVWMLLLIERKDRALNNSAVSFLGVLSYSIYLWQQPFTLMRPMPLLPSLAALFGCALGSYYIVEKPMLALGKSTLLARISGAGRRVAPLESDYCGVSVIATATD